MIKATQRPRKNRNSRGNVIYDSSFATGRQNYISGAAAPDDFWAERSQEEIHRSNKDVRLAARRNREQVMHMNRRYALFMACLMAAMTFCLIGYIKLQSDISSTNSRIVALESQLAEMKSSNNEVYNEIVGDIDLEQIRRIAIDEFGMQYADQDQIVVYSDTKGDTVHQVVDIER